MILALEDWIHNSMIPYTIPLVLATLLSIQGLRSRSLSPSGAAAAFIVGFSMLAVPVRAFGFSLIIFYLVGSRATRYGKERKRKLEDGYQAPGYRTMWQVLCNSWTAFIASALWNMTFSPDAFPGSLLNNFTGYAPSTSYYTSDAWCPLDRNVSNGLSRFLVFAALGHFACCLGDTLASELGILAHSPPILITTFQAVPPGTNGGISLGGTMASITGGFIMGVTLFVSLTIENTVCRQNWSSHFVPLLMWGSVAGSLGSLLDSLLGATVQRTRYSVDQKVILQDDSVPLKTEKIKVISGVNILTNNQVNFVSSMVTGVVLAYVA